MVTLINIENVFNKIPYPVMIKILKKNDKGNFLSLIKGIYGKPRAKHRGF